MSGFSSFFSTVSSNAKQMANQAAETVKKGADSVKERAAGLDTVQPALWQRANRAAPNQLVHPGLPRPNASAPCQLVGAGPIRSTLCSRL